MDPKTANRVLTGAVKAQQAAAKRAADNQRMATNERATTQFVVVPRMPLTEAEKYR